MGIMDCGAVGVRVGLLLAFICIRIRYMEAQTNERDRVALVALTSEWENLPPNWIGSDPCGSGWEGITCSDSRITEIKLSTTGVKGRLTGDLTSLTELQFLDLSYNRELDGPLPPNIGDLSKLTSLILIGCGFGGRIPDSLGSLEELINLSLNDNRFIGEIPGTIGNLKKLLWLDLSDNQLRGSIPVSSGDTPGLDLLVNTNHFHFGKNKLSGPILPRLFNSKQNLIHVLFDNNELSGSIPETLGLVSTLQAIRFDRNNLSGDLPSNISNLTSVHELFMSHNALSGPIPDLTGMSNLWILDLSNNSFDATEFPQWLTSLQSLRTLMMEKTNIEGQIPEEFFDIPQLQTVILKNNRIDGTFKISSSSGTLQLIDLQNNKIDDFRVPIDHNFTLDLVGNPICARRVGLSSRQCKNEQVKPYSTLVNCPGTCDSDLALSPNCKCAYPYSGILTLRAPSSFGDPKFFPEFQRQLLLKLQSFSLPVDSIALRVEVPVLDELGYLNMQLQIFPTDQYFNRTGANSLGQVFSIQEFKPDPFYGPYGFNANNYKHFEGLSGNNQSRTGIIIGTTVGASILLLLLICTGIYAYCQRKRVNKAKQQCEQTSPFVSWNKYGTDGDIPQLRGAKFFTFEELQKCTNNFSEDNTIGSGGYGKVYKGIRADGQVLAIKRSQQGSVQGSKEFKNEIELLSRVHHKNLAKLVGFCFDKGEQTLVYEFIPNGTLMDSLLGTSGIQMDWVRRVMVTLGSARGLHYLHELADPPIIHRDIKSNNILLDERLNAKVADFGLSKLFGDVDQKGYVTTQVKGTMGYLDPEYFMTNQLTEKSDIFSFGVVMLEMVTARRPIQDGKYIVRVIKEAMDRSKDLYDLHRVLDPVLLTNTTTLVGLEKFVDLALKCVQDEGVNRPTMGEVVKEIELIVQIAGMNPNADFTPPSSQTYESTGHPYYDDTL